VSTAAAPSQGPADAGTGVALVLVGVLSVQFGAVLATQLFPLVGPGGAVWVRLVLAAVLMAVVFPPSRLRVRGSDRERWSREAWVAVVAFGAGLALMNWSFYESLDRIPLGVAVALEFLGPLTLSLVLSRRRTDVAWAVGAAAGIAALTLDLEALDALAGGLDPVGVLLALVAGALWAAYILLSRRVGRLVPGTRGLSAALVVGALLLAPVGLAAGDRLLDWRVLALGAGVAVLSTALAYGVELEALRRIPARLFGILMSTEPMVAALVGLALLGQLLQPVQWAGVAAVCIAGVGATATSRRR
jgi:inner membrane transporter RhtA